MWKWLWRKILARYEWLRPTHPIAVRDARWMPYTLPLTLRRLAAPWTLLGYSAVVHGALFVISVVTYNHMLTGMATLFMPFLSPFLTPFGTPIAAGVLHSVLYWAMLIGIANQMSYGIASELQGSTWQALRLTPFTTTDILLTKSVVVLRTWMTALNTLTIVRMLALLVLPLAIASQRTREVSTFTAPDVISAGVFLLQPYVESFMVVGISAGLASVLRSTLWSKIYSLGAVGLSLGLLNGSVAFWLAFTSPMGALAGLLVPLGHWAPLAGAVLPPRSPTMYGYQTVLLVLAIVILPLMIGGLGLYVARRRLQAEA